MITDSENNMMNQFFSLQWFGGGRFFFLLIAIFQMINTICRHSEVPYSDTYSLSITVFITKDSTGENQSEKSLLAISDGEKQIVNALSKIL